MFDTILGLPLHVLLVHAVVVLLPLVALATAWWAWRPPTDAGERVGWAVVGANLVLTIVTWVTAQAGEALQRRLGGGVAIDHGAMGRDLTWFALGLTAAAALLQLTRRAGGSRGPSATTPARLSGVLVVLVAAATVVWTVRTGHSGSSAAWSQIVQNTGK